MPGPGPVPQGAGMSMYLPNPDVGPTGAEPGEFIDWPLLSDRGPKPPPAPTGIDAIDAIDETTAAATDLEP